MAIFRHTADLPPEVQGAVVAIGNFDGVHRGHQAIIDKVGRLARELQTTCAVLTFEPHPRRFFQPDSPAFQLTGFRLKVRLIEALGVDNLFVLPFNQAFAALSAEDFVRKVLAEGLRARHVVVGDNFAFGHKRLGNTGLLEQLGQTHGFGVTVMRRVTGTRGAPYSSTGIRDYLKAGNPTGAAWLLGRYWEIEGRVQPGDKLGRKLGFPTANIELGDSLEPAYGVYAVRAGFDRAGGTVWHPGVANLGVRPTVGGTGVLLEVHLFDFTGNLYGHHLRVQLVEFLRPEKKFDGLEGLKAQIARDCDHARAVLCTVAAEDSI